MWGRGLQAHLRHRSRGRLPRALGGCPGRGRDLRNPKHLARATPGTHYATPSATCQTSSDAEQEPQNRGSAWQGPSSSSPGLQERPCLDQPESHSPGQTPHKQIPPPSSDGKSATNCCPLERLALALARGDKDLRGSLAGSGLAMTTSTGWWHLRVVHVFWPWKGLQGPVEEAVEEHEPSTACPNCQDEDEGEAKVIYNLERQEDHR